MEPDPHGRPLRRYSDPAYVPVADTLAQLREQIDRIDADIIALMAQRARCVKDAARFKADSAQVAAPARQDEVFAKARALAHTHDTGLDGFEGVVEATFRTMVAQYIACQARHHADMRPAD